MSQSRAALAETWTTAWPRALEAWSRYTRLTPPRLCVDSAQAEGEGLTLSFAMIRLVDQAIVVDLEQVERAGLGGFPVEVLTQ